MDYGHSCFLVSSNDTKNDIRKYSKGLFYLRVAILKNSVGKSYTASLNKARELLNDDVVKEILRSIGYKSFPEFCS